MVRTGLSQLVNSADDLELVGVAEDGDAAVTLAMEQEADVVLMDLSMPRMDGVRPRLGEPRSSTALPRR